ncbi:glycoside hydrolase family 16 protein [Gandjariella thermophila]|uniref:Endo-1,3-beta-glucanase n=1 Tax=Gandjariella thermophila TaxID=1931992 RepID=A0A4D4JFN1_9PSEU|nr:glycoside hydrolase family 16 protein [Gandjariella thermophila]GDY32707.1 endo-1,3-beta-glucanase [Gandjariella thermophila]
MGSRSGLRRWRTAPVALALAIGATGAAVGVAGQVLSAAPAAAAGAPASWRLTWSDEFTGQGGTAPDASRWRYDTGGGGWGNAELEYYTGNRNNSYLDGAGNLVIQARQDDAAQYSCWYGTCRYTSARLLTAGTFSQAYGRFEARIQIPRGQGMWPAFWALGNNIGSVGWPASGEIDVMENIGREPASVHGSLHGPSFDTTSTYTLPGGAFADGFHTFAADWYPDHISFSVDGQVYDTRYRAASGSGWVFDHPFFLLLNVAVGGNWPGSPDGSTSFPQRMLVDYVRVYAPASPTTAATGQITGIGGRCVDVNGANTANGTAVQLYDCNGTAAQNWTMGTDGTIRALGKCMDVTGAGTANGTPVQLYDCNGTGAQQWLVESNGQLFNPNSGRCLDATNNSSANLTRLQVWDCYGSGNQTWNVP